jgi:hypothetical protein
MKISEKLLNILIKMVAASVFFFIGKFWSNFNLKNMISTHSKKFCYRQNGPNLSDLDEKNSVVGPNAEYG